MAANERNAGFIFLHRSLRDHWLWSDSTKFQWWVDILMECNHEDNRVSIGFEVFDCKRGQSVKSLETWGKRWKVDLSTVRRFFRLCEKDSMIIRENLQKTTRITVCNYDFYNDLQQLKQRQSNGKAIAAQPRSNSDAIQTKNDLKNEERNIGAFAPGYKKMTEKEFYDAIAVFKNDYPKDLLREFYDYWREAAPDGRMLFQLKKTWDLKLRLKRWQRNNLPGMKKKTEQPGQQAAPLEKMQTL
jgi:hypothetical protein